MLWGFWFEGHIVGEVFSVPEIPIFQPLFLQHAIGGCMPTTHGGEESPISPLKLDIQVCHLTIPWASLSTVINKWSKKYGQKTFWGDNWNHTCHFLYHQKNPEVKFRGLWTPHPLKVFSIRKLLRNSKNQHLDWFPKKSQGCPKNFAWYQAKFIVIQTVGGGLGIGSFFYGRSKGYPGLERCPKSNTKETKIPFFPKLGVLKMF